MMCLSRVCFTSTIVYPFHLYGVGEMGNTTLHESSASSGSGQLAVKFLLLKKNHVPKPASCNSVALG